MTAERNSDPLTWQRIMSQTGQILGRNQDAGKDLATWSDPAIGHFILMRQAAVQNMEETDIVYRLHRHDQGQPESKPIETFNFNENGFVDDPAGIAIEETEKLGLSKHDITTTTLLGYLATAFPDLPQQHPND